MVLRTHDNIDRRVILVQLSSRGKLQLKQIRDEFVEHYKGLIKHFGRDESEHFIRLLVNAAEFLEKTEAV